MRNKTVSDKILSRIKKLMMLGMGDPDSPEAKSAMEKAAELMQQYNVAEMDLDNDGHVKTDQLAEEFVEVYSKNTEIWEAPLGSRIAKAFDCKMISIRSGRGLPTRAFLGTKSDMALAVYFYKFIRMQIMRGAESNYKLIKDQKAYGWGCTVKVIERLEEMYVKQQEVRTSSSTALILVKKDDVAKFYKQKYPNVRKKSSGRITGSANAFNKGQQDGSKIQMSRQVGNKSATGAVMIGG